MSASERMLLALLCVASVRSHLLPIDLSGLSSGLVQLGPPRGGILSGLGDILSTGVNTVGPSILGILDTLRPQREKEPSSDTNSRGYNSGLVDSSDSKEYSHWNYFYPNTKSDQSRHMSNTDLNKYLQQFGRFRTYDKQDDGSWTVPPKYQVTDASSGNHESDYYTTTPSVVGKDLGHGAALVNRPGKNIDDGENNLNLDREPTLGNLNANTVKVNHESKRNPSLTENHAKLDITDDVIHFPDSDVISKPAKDVILLQNQNGDMTTARPIRFDNNQIIILQPSGSQLPNTNGIYVMPGTGSNLSYQGSNVAPNFKMLSTYTDSQGRVYYIIQPNNINQATNQPIHAIISSNPNNNEGYVLMNINGQQVLVPSSSLPVNGAQVIDAPELKPDLGSQQPSYVLTPLGNGEYILQNSINTPTVNKSPGVSYVTIPNVNNEKTPITNKNVPDISKVLSDSADAQQVNDKLDNTKDITEGVIDVTYGPTLPIVTTKYSENENDFLDIRK